MKNNSFLFIAFLAFSSFNLLSQSPEWEDLSVFKINTTAPHAHFELYGSKNEKIKDYPSTLEKSLNGTWNFKLFPKHGNVPQDFFSNSFN